MQLYSIVHRTWIVHHCPPNLVHLVPIFCLSTTTLLHCPYSSAKPNYLMFPKYALCFSYSSYAFAPASHAPGMPPLSINLLYFVCIFWSLAIPSLLQGSCEISPPRNLSCDLLWTPRVYILLFNCLPCYYHHCKLFMQRKLSLASWWKGPGIWSQRICSKAHCSLTKFFRLGKSFILLNSNVFCYKLVMVVIMYITKESVKNKVDNICEKTLQIAKHCIINTGF